MKKAFFFFVATFLIFGFKILSVKADDCTSWTYSDWSACSVDGIQTRTIITSLPDGCSGGSPVLNQTCTPPPQTCTSWAYSDWSSCSADGQQIRTITSFFPYGCIGGEPVLSQGCTPVCTTWVYSDWGSCSTQGMQTRNIISSSPDNCSGGNPTLSQSCIPPQTCSADTWTCDNWSTCNVDGNQTRNCSKSYDCPNIDTASPATNQSCVSDITCGSWGECINNKQQRYCYNTKTYYSYYDFKSCYIVSVNINSISPQTIVPGDVITIYGSNFGTTKGYSELYVGGTSYFYGKILSWSDNEIKYQTSSFDSYSKKIGIKKCSSYINCQNIVYGGYFYIQPKINSLSLYSGPVGSKLSIYGNYLADSNVASDNSQKYFIKVYFNNIQASFPLGGIWTSNQVDVFVPEGATNGYVSLEIIADTGEKVTAIGPYFEVWQKISNDEYSELQTYFKQINIAQAWGLANNKRVVTVAVIDDGVYSNHPDLKNKMWENTDEVIGDNRDNDNNGYKDDRYGWNYVNNSSDATPMGTHGTLVAGIIGAEKDNVIGIAGINENIKIMPLIVCSDKYGCIGDINRAIRYAVDNGAEVINISLGTNWVSGYETKYDDAIKYAFDHNVLIATAAGNGDTVGGLGYDLNTIPQSPVCNDGDKNMIIGVGAVNKDNYRTIWSNYGSKCVDIYAPGENIVSTAVPAFSSLGSFYDIESGTSFSSPIITGIISLLKATYPTLTSQEAINLLINNSNNGVVDAYKTISANFIPSNSSNSINNGNESSQKGTAINSLADSKKTVEEEKKMISKIDYKLSNKLSGQILLQVEKRGEGWYVYPGDKKKYFLGRPADAFNIMRKLGLGAKHSVIKNSKIFPNNLTGKILIDVEDSGKAYYINPKDKKSYYLGKPDDAFQVMRKLGLGITNNNIRKIEVGEIK